MIHLNYKTQSIFYKIIIISFLYAFLSLLSAYIIEFVGFEKPCPLCLYQRYILWCVIISTIGIRLLVRTKLSRFYYIIPMIYIVNFGIAAYHSGIELKIFTPSAQCQKKTQLSKLSVKDLRHELLQTKSSHCDQPSWKILNLSMANYNMIFSLCILLIWFYYFTIKIQKKRNDNVTRSDFSSP